MLRGHVFFEKLESALPFLPFMALGIQLAWLFIGSSGIAWISNSDLDGSNISVFNATANAGIGIVLVLAAFKEERFKAFANGPRAIILGSLLSAVGCIGIVAVGPYYLGPTLGTPLNMTVFCIFCAMSGMGLAPLILRCAELYGSLAPRKAIIYVAFSHIVAAAIYFIIAGTPVWAPAQGGPSLMGIVSFAILPLLAALFVSLSYFAPNASQEPTAVPQAAKAQMRTSKEIYRLTIVALVFSVAIVAVRAVVVDVSVVSFTQAVVSVDMLLRMCFAALFILIAVGMSGDSFDVGRLYSIIMSASVALMVLAPIASGFSSGWSQFILVVNDIFDFVFWCILSFIVYQKKLSPYRIFGLGWGAYTLGSAIGWLLGSRVMASLVETNTGFIVDVILAVSVLVCAFVLFSEKQLDGLFKPETADQPSLNDLMNEPLEPEAANAPMEKEGKGHFSKVIGSLAKEYHLSKRETEALKLLAMGYRSDVIAQEMQVSWSTARTHTRNVYSKMGVHSKQELISLVDERVRLDRS